MPRPRLRRLSRQLPLRHHYQARVHLHRQHRLHRHLRRWATHFVAVALTSWMVIAVTCLAACDHAGIVCHIVVRASKS